MHFPPALRALICFLALAALLGAAPLRAEYAGAYPFKAVATTGMVGDMVRRIAGERATVTDLMSAGIDPHLYKPGRGDLIALKGADIVFYSGLKLEGQMSEILAGLSTSKPSIAIAEAIPSARLLGDDHHHDPHVWMDAALWLLAAEKAHAGLVTFDPKGKTIYEANMEILKKDMAALDTRAREAIASIPKEARVLVTAHDAFSYFGRAYDIEVMGIQGISTESEAGLQDINRMVELLVSRKIPAVFVESSVSEKNVRALVEGAAARGHKVAIGGSLFSDAMGKAGTPQGTYIGMIDHNVETIVKALKGKEGNGE